MDSDHSDSSHGHADIPKTKKRRLHGACDSCRKRKIKCDSAARPGNICTNCETSNVSCTHDIPRQPKKKDTQQAYIQNLEERLSKMERLLNCKNPGADLENLLEMPQVEFNNAPSPSTSTTESSSSFLDFRLPHPPHLPSELPPSQKSSSRSGTTTPNEAEDLAHIQLAQHMSNLSMADERFFGQSSSFMFAKHAMAAKGEATGKPQTILDVSNFRRPLYWDLRPWELSLAQTVERSYVFPDPDLLEDLIALYFDKSNTLLPILHRPSFIQSLHRGQHLFDSRFGMTVLLACAVASRYSHDPRVLSEGDTVGLSCGWNYFSQVPIFRNYLFYQSSIYDLQYYALAVVYLLGTSIPHASWALLGLGVRFALEKGLHRRMGFQKNSMEEEMAKRAFWCLLVQDRWMSAFLGRPCAVQDEDFDVEFPAECDDEYWETDSPNAAFKQPPGTPSRMSYMIAQIRLTEILAFTLRTLYSTKKSKMLTGMIGKDWEIQVVTEIDSSLNKWKDSLPHFLRWDPKMPDNTFFHQSTCLHVSFFYLQIQVHRPFLTKKSLLSLPSLAICSASARSCVHVLEVALTRGLRPFPVTFMAAFAAAMVLLLNYWVQQRKDPKYESKQETELLRICRLSMKECEKRWHVAGRLVDMLDEMGGRVDPQTPSGPKRRRDSESESKPLAPAMPKNPSTRWSPEAYGSMGRAIFDPDSPPSANLSSPPPSLVKPPSEMRTFDNASSMPANNWDFSNLLMAQMGYMQQQQQYDTPDLSFPLDSMPVPVDPAYLTGVSGASASYVPRASFPNQQTLSGDGVSMNQSTPTIDASQSVPEDLFAMWSNLPNTFNTQDWDNFLKTDSNLGC
ncbi:fungal-specific transcription factor domain-containing protein [Crepidotus variabilis]|uniref:Fungal-specific transcription factor domain-containing protein n=1 Tax=Crepidotus variabilis TaxID=179855 RepID=A0A9P6JQT5_9AGAR|nr:fungal-specific transcription factor domain-containing protein [Crepidotus variabilis]